MQTPDHLKTRTGEEAFNPSGLSQRAISKLKDAFPDLEVYTDVALDPYNSDGHDGIVRDDGVIMNDETIEFLCRQAVSQARAGADVVSPSDMMDGRVGAIRSALDREGFTEVTPHFPPVPRVFAPSTAPPPASSRTGVAPSGCDTAQDMEQLCHVDVKCFV